MVLLDPDDAQAVQASDLLRTSARSTWGRVFNPALDAAGKIWVGATTNFGWLEPDAHGTLQYVSLVEKIPAEQRRFIAVWQVAPTSQGIFFCSNARLFRWDGQRMQVWATKTSFEALAAVRGRIYTSQTGIGLQEVVGDALRELPGGGAWKDSRRLRSEEHTLNSSHRT